MLDRKEVVKEVAKMISILSDEERENLKEALNLSQNGVNQKISTKSTTSKKTSSSIQDKKDQKASCKSSPKKKNLLVSKPINIMVLGKNIPVDTWKTVLEQTFNRILEKRSGKFEDIIKTFPTCFGRQRYISVRKLKNGCPFETNFSSEGIIRICLKAMETIGVPTEEWSVEQTYAIETRARKECKNEE